MNTSLRLTTALLLALAVVSLAPCTPALAQSSSPAAQYQGGGSGHCPPDSICVQSLNDGADAFSENAGQGTDAVNEALEEPEASANASGSVRSAASATAESSSAEGDTNGEGGPEGPGKVTELPETGGAPLAALGSGVLLVMLGLMAHRLARR